MKMIVFHHSKKKTKHDFFSTVFSVSVDFLYLEILLST